MQPATSGSSPPRYSLDDLSASAAPPSSYCPAPPHSVLTFRQPDCQCSHPAPLLPPSTPLGAHFTTWKRTSVPTLISCAAFFLLLHNCA